MPQLPRAERERAIDRLQDPRRSAGCRAEDTRVFRLPSLASLSFNSKVGGLGCRGICLLGMCNKT